MMRKGDCQGDVTLTLMQASVIEEDSLVLLGSGVHLILLIIVQKIQI